MVNLGTLWLAGGIVIGVLPLALISIYAIEATPCQGGTCWPRLTIGQVLVLTMLLLSALIRFLQFLSEKVVKYVVPAESGGGNESELLIAGQETIKDLPEVDGSAKIPNTAAGIKAKSGLLSTCDLLVRLGSIMLLFFICDIRARY